MYQVERNTNCEFTCTLAVGAYANEPALENLLPPHVLRSSSVDCIRNANHAKMVSKAELQREQNIARNK